MRKEMSEATERRVRKAIERERERDGGGYGMHGPYTRMRHEQ